MYIIPQIVHTALQGRRFQKFPYLYFCCYLFARIAIQVYQRGCPENYYLLKPNYQYCIALVVALSIQFIFALMQHFFGSRFFIPKICRPSYYNYFTTYVVYSNKLPEDDDCCICMQHLYENPEKEQKKSFGAIERLLNDSNDEAIIQEISNETLQNPLLRDESKLLKGDKIKCKIMITPCKHKFHVSCLESWMKIKLVCPTCRANLPSIE